jgi:mRNA interferase MazF
MAHPRMATRVSEFVQRPTHAPSRGDVWMVDLSPTRGREQDGMRPGLVLSVDKFNHGPADLVIVIPITKTQRNIPTHVKVPMGEAGLTFDSYIKCEDIRSISKDRLVRYMGAVTSPRIESVQKWVRVLLGL